MDDLYRQVLLDHYKNPRNYGTIEEADIVQKDSNPTCGDVVEFYLKLDDNNKVSDVKFEGVGCVICMASSSMLTTSLLGKTLEEIKNMDRDDMMDIINIKLDHVRIKCATLSLHAVKKGIGNRK